MPWGGHTSALDRRTDQTVLVKKRKDSCKIPIQEPHQEALCGPKEKQNVVIAMTPSWLESILTAWVPDRNPFPWIMVNSVCCSFSIYQLLVTLFAEDDASWGNFAKRSYLFWNFGTTLVWCLEIGLQTWWYKHQNFLGGQEDSFKKWQLYIELTLAVYFTLDSINVLYAFKIKNEDVDAILVEVLLNVIAYTYIMVDTIKAWRRRRQESSSAPHDQYETLA